MDIDDQGLCREELGCLPETWVSTEMLCSASALALIRCVTSTSHLASLVLFPPWGNGDKTTLPVAMFSLSVSYRPPLTLHPGQTPGEGSWFPPGKEVPPCSLFTAAFREGVS